MTNNAEKLNSKQAPLDSCQTNGVIPRKWTARIIIAVAISIYLLAVLFRQEVLVGGSSNTLAFLLFFVGFPFVTIFSSATYFRHAENAAKAGIFITGSLSAILSLAYLFSLMFCSLHFLVRVWYCCSLLLQLQSQL